MKIVEIDGAKEYRFEASEQNARTVFEQAINTISLSDLVTAILKATKEQTIQQNQAWLNIAKAIHELDPDCEAANFSYNWLTAAFIPQKSTVKEPSCQSPL